ETELIELGKALIAVAKDRQRDNADRRKAILALGDVGTSDSIDFLVEHIRLSLPFDKSDKDTNREFETPCQAALMVPNRFDWNVVPVILHKAINQSVDAATLKAYREVLVHNLQGASRLRSFIAVELKLQEMLGAPDEIRIMNLKGLLNEHGKAGQ